MLGDRQAAEDVLHEVFVSFARRIAQVRLNVAFPDNDEANRLLETPNAPHGEFTEGRR